MITIAKRSGVAAAFGLLGLALSATGVGRAEDRLRLHPNQQFEGARGGPAIAGAFKGGFHQQGGPVGAPAAGQLVPNYANVVNPYNPAATMASMPASSDYGGYNNIIGSDPYGGYLKGAAAVIDAQGRYLINLQTAYSMREDLRKKQLESRRAAYEEWLWERANLPTLEDERERVAREQLRRAQNDPPLPEVWSGEALNVLLKSAQGVPKTVQAPNIPLDEDVVAKINLNSGKAGINFGLLKNEGQLTWPLSLRNLRPAADSQDLRDHMQRLAKQAFDQAKNGQIDPNTVRELEKTTDRLQKQLVGQVGDMSFADYSEGKRYLSQLYDGIKALREPNAGDIANGKFKLKGATVGEVVDYMTKNGLRFAPAVAGEESAYVALHRALANYGAAVARLTTDHR